MEKAALIRIRSIWLSIIITIVVGISTAFAITWGQIDEDQIYKNVCMVGISVYDNESDEFVPVTICSGTLIHERAVITAGHCIEYVETLENIFSPENVRAEVMFDYDLTSSVPGDGIEIDEHIKHPNYFWGPASNPYDVGVLTFEQPFEGITPAILPNQNLLNDLKNEKVLSPKSKFTVVGYGCTVDWPPPVVYFDDSFIRRHTESEYRALLPAWLKLSQNKATDDAGSCFGDSGGPVFWTDPITGDDILVGITSWGDPHCISPSFNYRVDIPDTLDFINGVIESIQDD